MALRDMPVRLQWQTEAGRVLGSCLRLGDTTRAQRNGSISGFDCNLWGGTQDEAQRSDHTRVLSWSDCHPGGCTACCTDSLRLRSVNTAASFSRAVSFICRIHVADDGIQVSRL